MYKDEFYTPQRQSATGVLLIFATSLYHIIRSFWAVGIYLLVMNPDSRTLFLSGIGLAALLIIILLYSLLYYLRFLFYVDKDSESFILEKGVFSTDVVNIPFNKIQQVNFKRNILQRVIGVYSVVIDTAGSTDKEVEIKALSKEKADVLATLLMELSSDKAEAVPAVESQEEDTAQAEQGSIYWQHTVDFLTLLKLGLTSNYLRGISILIAFYLTVRSQFSFSEELPAEIPYSAIAEVSSTAVLILILLLVGMIFTVAETLIKYHNLRLTRTASGLQVEMGLRENTRVNLKERRVQVLEETTNPVQQRLDLYKLKVSLASSGNDLGKDQIKIPGLTPEVMAKVKDYFYGKEVVEKYLVLPHKILLFRKFMKGSLPVLAGFLALYLFAATEFPMERIGALVLVIVLLISVYQYFYFKTIRLFVSEDFLVKCSGIWVKKKQYLEIYKLQSVSVSQPVWYKKRKLVSITFHSAGGDIEYPLVNEDEVLPLMNYILYKIEVTSKSWM